MLIDADVSGNVLLDPFWHAMGEDVGRNLQEQLDLLAELTA